LTLGVRFLAARGSLIQRLEDRLFRDIFQCRPGAKMLFPQRCTEVLAQKSAIGKKPGLHHLDHQERLILDSPAWAIPVVSRLQVLPCRATCLARPLAVDQEERELPRSRISHGGQEQIEGSLAAPAADDARHAASQARSPKKTAPALPESGIQ